FGDTTLNFTASKFQKYSATHNDERVYLHLDKPNYGFGDTIWYKAYTVIGQKHQPSALSGVLYVELISPTDSLVARQSIPLVSGIGWSDIPLPFTLKPGSYRLRAYTRWMRNFGPDAFDEQPVVIGGIAPVVIRGSEKVDVQFFPEGGELVEGVRSRVAIKAVGANGLGKAMKGTIEDSSGNVVADFTTRHLGMGAFALIPESEKSYRARINIAGETAFTIDLPKAKPIGYTFSVNNSEKDSIYVKIATNDKTLAANRDKSFYIIAQSNGNIYYTTQGKLESTVYTAAIAKNRFPEGIAQFTLFSQSGEPLAERIAFIENKADEISLTLDTNSQRHNTRDKVILNLTARDSANRPVTGSFSVAVINETEVSPEENTESTILNNLLLTSELKGYIEQPNYYFTNQCDKTRSDLDLLMLTQGYRRYEWKQILNPTIQQSSNIAKQQYLPERSQELSGTITTPGGKPVPNSKIILAATKQGIFRDTIADENGRFTFTGLNITDTATVMIKARKANNGSNVKIVPEQPDYPKIIAAYYPEEIIATDTAKAWQQYSNYQKDQKDYQFKSGKLLKTVTIKGIKHPPQPKLQFSSNLNGPGHANQVIMGNELGDGCIDLTDCLEGKVLGVIFDGNKGWAHTMRSLGRFNVPNMRIIVDGVMLDPKASLNDINASDIYSIEVLRSGAYLAIYGSNAAGGALIITMKHGNEGTAHFTQMQSNGITTTLYVGFYKAKTFYMPKYDILKKDAELRDERNTIYWNPNVITDQDGKATLDFYNNDAKGIYRMVVEGIDDDGKLGGQVYRYEVK
ncbi:MAG TPA: carboxypeptidase regulatory-like domain-containing protein, partial [Mucilaginibacter sp.]|nr:carboxypeptidase regulatory-like domain-containing protein [Mucilaginibacter sp.]